MVKAARIHQAVRHAAEFGTRAGEVTLDWPAVIRRQHAVVAALRPSPEGLAKAGARVYVATARFLDPHTLAVDGQRVAGEKVIVAAGSEPVIPPIEGRELALTSDDLLFLPERPEHLLFVGGGVIATELASAFADFGTRVTVVGVQPQLLPGLDADVAAYLQQRLEAKGVSFHLGAEVRRLSGRPGAITALVAEEGGTVRLDVTHVCLAAGRRLNAAGLGADRIGLETAGTGLKVTPHLRTSVPHIYAAGDAAGGAMLTPLASYEGKLAARNALEGDVEAADYTVVPSTIFSTPEVGRVGLTHREALQRGVPCHVSTHDMKGASNGRATGEEGGYLKLVFEGPSERLVGVQMVSYAAAELIQLAALAVKTGTSAATLSSLLSIHPSHGERFIKVAAHDYHEVCEV